VDGVQAMLAFNFNNITSTPSYIDFTSMMMMMMIIIIIIIIIIMGDITSLNCGHQQVYFSLPK
jgi:hypothetical protein